MIHPEIDIKMIDLDHILYGEPTTQEVVAFFERGEFDSEEYQVEAIEKHLLTEEQRKLMFDHRLTIEKVLNGRYGEQEGPIVIKIFKEWNDKLGFKLFGF